MSTAVAKTQEGVPRAMVEQVSSVEINLRVGDKTTAEGDDNESTRRRRFIDECRARDILLEGYVALSVIDDPTRGQVSNTDKYCLLTYIVFKKPF